MLLALILVVGVVNGLSSRRHFEGWEPCYLRDMYAECELQPNHYYFHPSHPSSLSGVVRFSQFVDTRECRMGDLHVDVYVENFPMLSDNPTSEHGFHVTQGSDLSHSCYSLGPHFNPYHSPHGAPWMPYYRRHVGDFGNLERRGDGTIRASFTDYLATLMGRDSIIGRGLEITERRNDLGIGGEDSLVDGNSGPPVACCVIQRI